MEGEGEVEGDVDVHIAPVYTVAKFGILVCQLDTLKQPKGSSVCCGELFRRRLLSRTFGTLPGRRCFCWEEKKESRRC